MFYVTQLYCMYVVYFSRKNYQALWSIVKCALSVGRSVGRDEDRQHVCG